MDKHIKKDVAVFTLIVLFFNIFFYSFALPAHAADSIRTDDDGKIYFTTTSTKATTGVIFKTVGFTITRSTKCSGGQCDPTTGKHGEVRVKQVHEVDNKDGTVTTYFEVPEKPASEALESAGLQGISHGGTIYLHSIFHIIRNGIEDNTDYYDLASIKKAEGWKDPNRFRQYYDIPVPYLAKFEVTKIYRTSTGDPISDAQVVNPDDKDKKWPIGKEINVELDKTVTHKGKTYSLVKSYLQSKHRLNDQEFVQTGTPSTNPKLTKRSFTTHLGGTNVIGVYKEGASNPVEAIYETADGRRIKTVDKGEKAISDSVNHTFEGKVGFNGEEYEIIRSYVIQNEKPNDKQYVLEKGDPNLLNRNLTVGKGGAKFVGIYKESNDGGGGTDPGDCSCVIGPPSKGTVIPGGQMNASAIGILRADNRGSEIFNVDQGIPTSESLFANVFGMNYLFQSKWAKMTGQVTYKVTVTKVYHKTWTIPGKPPSGPKDPGVPDKPMEKDVTVTKDITVKRDYSYWIIDNLEVYKLDKSTVSNYALGGYGGTITLNPNGYNSPTLDSDNDDSVNSHVHPQPCSSVDLGTENVPGGTTEPDTPLQDSLFQSSAEDAVKEVKVNNDKVVFNGSTIMDNSQVDKAAPTPGAIPQPTTIGQNVLYKSGNVISNTLVNKANQPTTGKIFYALVPGNIKGGSNKNFDVKGMNKVTVHTPVVDYGYVSDDAEHNQKTKPNYNRDAFILDRPFTVSIPTTGQHQNYKNYGNRDYRKWTKDRQVQFEFGVLSKPNDNSSYIPPGTWVSFPDGVDTLTFYMPVWVDEGDYKVYTRAIAENAPSGFTTATEANLDWQNHVATRTIEVEVIGRLYDFRVTDIVDYNWETVFRTASGSNTPTSVKYPVGDKGIDGEPNGFVFPYELPIRRGSHPNPQYKNVAVKTGYHFKFDLKSKGNMCATCFAITE